MARLNGIQILFLAMACLMPGPLLADKVDLRFLSWDSLNTTVLNYQDTAGYTDEFCDERSLSSFSTRLEAGLPDGAALFCRSQAD